MSDTEQWQELSELHEDFKKRIAELEACCRHRDEQITTLHNFNNAKDKRIAELEAKIAGKPAYNCPKCNGWFSEDEAAMGKRIGELEYTLRWIGAKATVLLGDEDE